MFYCPGSQDLGLVVYIMFVDSVVITLRAGKGGNGIVSWRREKYIPKGGPVGGNGGKGASILFKTDSHTHSLEGFRNRRLINADNGMPGGTNLQKGRHGRDLVLPIPCGTLIKNAKTKEVLFDITELGEEVLICKGGKGGKGNACFKSPTNQAPNICTPGTEGEILEVELELKLIADIGLIGMPNAGKSTLLSKITRHRVKIGAYPFTTLYPNLGYVQAEDRSRILVADIPGLIENAHLDKGLGIAFLKHVERSSALIYVIDIAGSEGRDPFEDFQILQSELKAYRADLLEKPCLIALNKIDAEGAEEQLQSFLERCTVPQEHIFPISAMNGIGLEPLIAAMQPLAQKTVEAAI